MTNRGLLVVDMPNASAIPPGDARFPPSAWAPDVAEAAVATPPVAFAQSAGPRSRSFSPVIVPAGRPYMVSGLLSLTFLLVLLQPFVVRPFSGTPRW